MVRASEPDGDGADRLPVQDRPLARLEQLGPAALSSVELLGLVWGRQPVAPARRVAEACLAQVDGLDGLAKATAADLQDVPGVGRTRAAQLAAAVELGKRVACHWPSGRWTVRSPRDVADRFVPSMGRLEREEMHVVLLNARNAVLATENVYVGNVSAAVVRIGELFRDAVRRHAAGLILVHNHPSGDPTPSPDDLHLTAEAIAAGRLLDVAVLDHLVIGHDAWLSLRDRGVTFDERSRR
jgi:DNA repair protein RadC